MLELYGSGYVIEFCISSLLHEKKQIQYQTYIADILRLAGENIAGLTRGNYVKTTWAEIMSPAKQDTRSGDEIARDIINRAKLRVKGGE